MRIRIASLTLALLLLTGCGGRSSVRLSIKIDSSFGTRHEHFTLRCNPPGGDMPNRKVLCRMIAAHPKAMLHPDPARTVCGGAGIYVTVDGSAPGGDVHLANAPACGWPGGVSVLAYWAAGDSRLSAAERNHYLAVANVRLHCDEDALLLRQPTAWSRVRACLAAQPKR